MQKNYFRYQEFIFLTFLTVLSLFTSKAVAQTTLAVGDLSIVSINSNTADSFTFVTWVNLLPNTEIKFTDNGFHSAGPPTASSNFRDQEQTVTWQNNTGATIAAGSVITINLSSPVTNTTLGAIVSSLGANGVPAPMTLTNSAGDQIFAYQGIGATAPVNNINSNFNGTLIFAISFSGWNVTTTNWVTSGAISGGTSYLPNTVTGTSSVFLGPNAAGAHYNGPTTGLATYGAYKAAIANPANWTTITNSAGVTPSFQPSMFYLGPLPVFTGNPPNRTICVGNNTTFPALVSNATSFQWQENSGSGFVNLSNGGVYSGATTATLTITGATAGMSGNIYRLVATGTGGPAISNQGTLTISNPTVTASSQTNVSCFGGSNGAATVTASGGIAPYSYSWSPAGGTGASATGLTAGTYTATITDNIGCTTTRSFTITQPSSAVSGTTVVTNLACNSATNGAINLTPSGGNGPYTYNWGSGITTEDRTGLAAGTYSVTITDINGCTGTVTATITQPVNAITATASQTNVSCNGGSNGTASVAVSGGTGTYTYSWSPSGGTGATASGLSAGAYTVTITDANLCTTTRNFAILQPTPLTATASQTNVSCNGGSNGTASVAVSGGTGAYTYSWSPSGGTGATASGLSAGTYTVTITDANLCTTTRNVTITQPTALTATASQTNVSCNGGSNGTASVAVSGGTGTYTYSWSPSGGTAATASGLSAGTYTVTITDANLCTTTRNVTITQPTALTSTASQTNIACNGGSNGTASVAVSGGTGTYTYSWSPSGGTAATATGLSAGTYTVTITDANLCTTTQSVTITQPVALTTTASQTNVSCNGGSNGTASVAVSGGTGTYTYSWSPSGGTAATASGLSAGTYTVTITDANLCTTTQSVTITQPIALTATASQTNVSCNGGSNGTASVAVSGGTGTYTYSWSPSGGTAATATGLSAGTYTVTITDANLCTTTQSVTITQPVALTATASQTNVSCNGGSNGTASVAVSGGTGTYTYSWSPSGGTAATATGLSAGTYTVTITDANLCTTTQSVTITQPTALTATVSQSNIACNGGSNGTASVTASGGTGTYSYSWSPSGGTGATASGLSAGTYTVTITDANLCTTSQSVTITEPSAIVITLQPLDASIEEGNTATFSFQSNGATNFQWQVSTNGSTWSDVANGGLNPTYSGSTTNMLTVTNVPIGYDGYLYRAIVSNGTSCTTVSDEATLSVSPPLGTPEYNFGQMTLYPNPAVTHVFIKIPFTSSLKYCKLEVFDINGRILLQKTLKDEVEKVDVDNLPNGVYIFTITSEYGSNSKKIIKQ